jgi:N-alpha-acetyl-L-2,4-diaminobutyrate deacetylase
MSEESLISCDVDFDQDGKQFGNLAVPQSTNSAGWAVSYIPLFVVKNGEGPTAVLFGGNHGDEYEGPVTLMNLARQLTPDQIAGRVIIVPMLNRPAVAAGTRLSPIDGVNMNRAYPGRRNDSITGMIAHFVSTRILPLADLVVDIHSGGSSMHMVPSVNMHDLGESDQMRRMLNAGRAWGAPYAFIYEDVAGEGLLPTLAERMGKATLGTEMGSKAQFGVETLRITARGTSCTGRRSCANRPANEASRTRSSSPRTTRAITSCHRQAAFSNRWSNWATKSMRTRWSPSSTASSTPTAPRNRSSPPTGAFWSPADRSL